MSRWIKIADVSELEGLRADQPSQPYEVEGYDIVLFKISNGYGALEDCCSHEYSRLSEGEVWDDRVYCVKHGSSFDCRTGAVRGLPATEDVRAYPTELRDDAVWVKLSDWE